MIIKKKKAVISALITAAMAVSAIVPSAVSAAGTRTKAEKYGDGDYASRFLSLYDDVITNGVQNGYLSSTADTKGGLAVPYHSVEELCIEAPDYGHITTSEAMSYIVWMAAMRDHVGNLVSTSSNGTAVEKTSDLAKAWKTMEVMIPTVQSGFFDHTELSAQVSLEHDDPKEYPSEQFSWNTGKNPLAKEFASTYKSDGGLYLMHWLADVDDWYGFGGDTEYQKKGGFVFINTFQRGAQESCWETVPHACVENLKYGMSGRGVKGIFQIGDMPKSWSYTNAPDAEDRAIQAVYAAKRWGVADSDTLSKAGKMGDQLRNNMFDKYYKPVAAKESDPLTEDYNKQQDTSNPYSGAHYLMSWYTSWGGALDGSWAWQIGASHCHEFYQNPLAAYALIADSDLKNGMKVGAQAVKDYETSLQRQLEFYLWLQSEDGPIAGGATTSWHGRYAPAKYIAGVDDEYITKYKTDVPTRFYGMAYQEHPVYADPGSNHWIGNQVWAVQRLAELYYDVKTNPTDVSSKIKAGGLSMEEALKKILDRWVEWFINNVELTPDGDYTIPSNLDWYGQPKDWNGAYQEKNGVTIEITGTGNSDLGCVSSLCNTLIWYAKANGVKTSAAYSSKNTDVPSKALYTAHALLDREWALGRDDIGLSRTEHNGSMVRLFEQEVWIPNDYSGTMPNGDKLETGATFLSIRSQYLQNEKVQEFKAAYEAAGGASASAEAKQEAMESVDLNYHRFWHAGDILVALGTMADLYPDLEVDKYDDSPVSGDEDTLTVTDSITVTVGKTEKISFNVDGSTLTSADPSVATVSNDGTVTGVKAGSTTVEVVTPKGQKATVNVTVTEGTSIDPSSLEDDDYIWGDVDLDTEVGISDAIMLSKYLAAPQKFPLGKGTADTVKKSTVQANTEYDDSVDGRDLSKIIEFVLGSLGMDDLGPRGTK